MQNRLEHINLTIRVTDASEAMLSHIFDWNMRWVGASKDEGRTIY
ncbi:MAG: hypothetical protein ACI9UT_001881 [Flavobacteriales bacterium]|jgi:hypothetical protein